MAPRADQSVPVDHAWQKPTPSALCTGLPPPQGRHEVPKHILLSGPASRMGSGQLGDTALVKAKRHQRAHKSLGKGPTTAQPEEIRGAQSTCARSDYHPDLTPSAQWPLSNVPTAGPSGLTTGQKPLLPQLGRSQWLRHCATDQGLGWAMGKNGVWGEGDRSFWSWATQLTLCRPGQRYRPSAWQEPLLRSCSDGPRLQLPQLYSLAEKSQALRFTSKK